MKRQRQFGGVKGAPVKAELPRRTFGGVKAPAPSDGVDHVQPRRCRMCEGRWVDGSWVHSDGCYGMAVLYKRHGYTIARWWCLYGCGGKDMGTAIVHVPDCPYWSRLANYVAAVQGQAERSL